MQAGSSCGTLPAKMPVQLSFHRPTRPLPHRKRRGAKPNFAVSARVLRFLLPHLVRNICASCKTCTSQSGRATVSLDIAARSISNAGPVRHSPARYWNRCWNHKVRLLPDRMRRASAWHRGVQHDCGRNMSVLRDMEQLLCCVSVRMRVEGDGGSQLTRGRCPHPSAAALRAHVFAGNGVVCAPREAVEAEAARADHLVAVARSAAGFAALRAGRSPPRRLCARRRLRSAPPRAQADAAALRARLRAVQADRRRLADDLNSGAESVQSRYARVDRVAASARQQLEALPPSEARDAALRCAPSWPRPPRRATRSPAMVRRLGLGLAGGIFFR